ncbi:MAG TPA: hypothetical protein VMF90_14050 [Rhizobiaceae bacterium]|nr:hypothetical protein [Rhizobiaceae bacterium]
MSDAEFERALKAAAAELDVDRDQAMRRIVHDWLIANAYLRVHELEEDSEVAGHS